MSNSSSWSIDRTLSSATTPGQSGPGSDGNEGILHIQLDWNFTIRLFSVIFRIIVGGVLPFCRDAVGVFYCSSYIERVLNISQSFRTGASPSNVVYCHTQDTHYGDASYFSLEVYSTYSTVSADRVANLFVYEYNIWGYIKSIFRFYVCLSFEAYLR